MKNNVSDIHGYNIAEGEFALFSKSNGMMKYGILCGKHFITASGTIEQFICVLKLYDDKLSDVEKECKVNVYNKYIKHCEELNARKNSKYISAKDNIAGHAYADKNGNVFLCFGHGEITTYFRGTESTRSGYIYYRIGNCVFKDGTDYEVYNFMYWKYILGDMYLDNPIYNPTINTTQKRFIAEIDYHSPIICKKFTYQYRDEYNAVASQFPDYSNKECIKFELS